MTDIDKIKTLLEKARTSNNVDYKNKNISQAIALLTAPKPRATTQVKPIPKLSFIRLSLLETPPDAGIVRRKPRGRRF